MANIVVSGDTSGAITLQAPAVAGSTTLNLPASSGTIALNGPAFSAYQSSAQTLSAATQTKILFQTEEFDTNNNFSSSTFTPTVAGYYQVTYRVGTGIQNQEYYTTIRKNGSLFKTGSDIINSSWNYGLTNSVLIYLNGSTDYIEVYVYFSGGGGTTASSDGTYFQAFLARAA